MGIDGLEWATRVVERMDTREKQELEHETSTLCVMEWARRAG